tara:strand:+ start:1342 stop:1479 length:138 start_codon:yes stop_codon:yes gene_type:complete
MADTAISLMKNSIQGTIKGQTINRNTMELMLLNKINGVWQIARIH